ncbi:hypothetical protein P154DRAFT_168967 [Amniculicola lignicola CBS 123094]|uniref:CBF1-interacting co-repressor CIR N-terminal domain-containing protein n=1 Tax=Amniculicola lignicola CBS 123094 TaxID=1392246 RepID=A0A6A5WQN4_9PLEO|nr:hypothetical protein P154DRAFT_168967 [Amniculicola lignicola CBS 123094]
MPLHLLGKKSWNVYNSENIARVRRDEAAAATAEAAEEQRMQEQDAARRMKILRGETPSPLPEPEANEKDKHRRTDKGASGHDRKRRRLAGEDDTAREIRLAKSATAPRDDEDVAVLKLRRPTSDAPLTDHAGHINLFPVDEKEAIKRQRKEEADKEKKKKEQALEDQYTMRFSNAAGKGGLKGPWYATAGGLGAGKVDDSTSATPAIEYTGYESKDVWGNEDPSRKEREQKRVFSNDPLALVNRGVADLKKYKEQKKKVSEERTKELGELKAEQEEEDRRRRQRKRKQQDDARLSEKSRNDSQRRAKDHPPRDRHYHRHRNRSEEREHRASARSEGERDKSRDRSHKSHERRSLRERRHSESRPREKDKEEDGNSLPRSSHRYER